MIQKVSVFSCQKRIHNHRRYILQRENRSRRPMARKNPLYRERRKSDLLEASTCPDISNQPQKIAAKDQAKKLSRPVGKSTRLRAFSQKHIEKLSVPVEFARS